MNNKFLLSCTLLASCVATSCVNNDWDLDDIDLTVGTNADITLPTSSTGEIILKNIIDLEEDGVVQIVGEGADAMYVVSQSGSANVDPIKIDPIKISRPNIEPFLATIDRHDFGMSKKRAAHKSISVDLSVINPYLGKVDVEIPSYSYSYKIKKEDNTNYDLKDAYADGITEDVISLENAKVSNGSLTLDLGDNRIHFINADQIDKVHLDDIVITYPRGIKLKTAKFIYNGIVHDLTSRINNDEGRLLINNGPGEALDIHKSIDLALTFDEIVFGDNITFTSGGANGGRVDISGCFRIDGGFRIETSDMKEDIIQEHLNSLSKEDIASMWDGEKVTLDLEKLGLIPEAINVKGEACFAGDINITSVSGTFGHTIGDIDPLHLDDMPDFLNDDDVVLDLANPLIFVSINNSLPASIKIGNETDNSQGIHLSANAKGETKHYATGALNITQGENHFMIADHNTTLRPASYQDKNVNFVGVHDVAGLVRTIPEQIDINVDPVTLHANDLLIDHEYPISIDYEVYAPLEFGDDFRLVYQDTERGWASDLKDVEDMNLGAIEINAVVESDLPASIQLSLIPIDEECMPITALTPITIDVPAGAKEQPINIRIEATDGHSINDVLTGRNGAQQLDGIKYRAEVKKGDKDDAALRPEAKVRLHDLQITVKGGITYDAN